ncbi:MAG: sulfite exporter TauE/SafE family protein, partial [Gemmatimonadales bacterium]|nr:sulfite exporter TauE/SafE family protein [Gemmatimonadales bacterium]
CATAGGRRPLGAAMWHLGRLSTYATLGMLAGSLGQAIPGPGWEPAAVSGVLLGWFALALAGLVPEPRLRLPGLGRAGASLAMRDDLGSRYLFGLTTGLLPCGLVYAALALPVALGEPALGALAMVCFGLGTIPALATLSVAVQRVLRAGLWPRRLLALAVLVAGMWSIAARQGWLGGGSPHGVHEPAVPHPHP